MAKFYFYFASMNAGKSTMLIQSDFNYKERNMKTKVFIPSIINKDTILSRIGVQVPAIQFSEDFNFFDYMTENLVDAVFIDEAQFLTKAQVFQLSRVVDFLDIPVLCYGIRSDFNGEPFEGSMYLLTLADKLVEIKNICECKKKATMNTRIGNDKNKVLIGGNDLYISMCRRCFIVNSLNRH
jgi:thymidine kinase